MKILYVIHNFYFNANLRFKAPESIDKFVYTYYFGIGHVGAYDFAYLYGQALQSQKTITVGFVAYEGTTIQNQCRYFPFPSPAFLTQVFLA